MFCVNCGKQLPDNARFCPYCGADQYAAWNGKATGSARQAAPPSKKRQQKAVAPQASRPAGKLKKKRHIVLKLFALLFVAAVIWNQIRPDVVLPKNKSYKPIVSQYSYNALPDDVTRGLYREISGAAYDHVETRNDGAYFFGNIPIKDGMTDTDFFLAYRAFLDDHPDVFWLGWGTTRIEPDKEHTLEPDYFVVYSLYSSDELKARKKELYEALEQFLDSVPAGLGGKELQEYAHDYLIDHCDYDFDSLNEEGDIDLDYPDVDRITAANGPLVDGKAVCSGYAHAYQLMLNRLGVECVPIYGQGVPIDDERKLRTGRVSHQWNAVKEEDGWVMTDATWDDVEDSARRHDYFHVSIEQMYADHNAQVIDFSTFQYVGSYISLNTEMDCLFLPR